MTRHYTVREFFRQMPKELLNRYFRAHSLLPEFDFANMEQAQLETVFKSWLALPDEVRGPIDAEFREIFDLACEKGVRAIMDEAAWQLRHNATGLKDFIGDLADLPGYFERAMTTFLDYRAFWAGAIQFYHAD